MIYVYPKNKSEHSSLIPTWRIALYDGEGNKKYFDTGIAVKGEEGSKEYDSGKKKAKKQEDELKAQIRIAKKTVKTKDEALKIANIITGYTGEKLPIEELKNHISKTLSTSSIRNNISSFNKFFSFCQEKKIKTIDAITYSIVKDFIDSLIAEHMKAKSIHVRIIHLGAMYSNAMPEAKENPFKKHKFTTSKLDKTVSRTPMSMEQIEKVLVEAKKIHSDLYEYISLAIRTAMRKGDMCMLKWENIDFDKDIISYVQMKTGNHVVLPIFEKLKNILLNLKSRREEVAEDDYVFPTFAKMYLKKTDRLTNWVKKAISRALHVETTIDQVYGKVRNSVYDIHSLRTSFVVNLAKSNVPINQIMAFTGHKSISTLINHYIKTTAVDYRENVKNILN